MVRIWTPDEQVDKILVTKSAEEKKPCGPDSTFPVVQH